MTLSTSETITDAINGNYSASYTYDNVGNRVQGIEAGVTTQYQYDDNDRISQQGGVTYTYDANGNTLEENDQGSITRYRWNSRNELVEHEAGGFITDYQYNGEGIRHSQSDGATNTTYLVDANRSYAQVLAESVNGSLDVAYHYGDDLLSQNRNGNANYFHVDGLGSTRVLTDASGNPTDRYGYAAFGEVLAQEGVTDNDYLYTGEQFDENLDQYYLRARYYDQGVGRFTRMDDWMGDSDYPLTLNKYLYANIDPISYVDPTGYIAILSATNSFSLLNTLASVGVSNVGRSLARVSVGLFVAGLKGDSAQSELHLTEPAGQKILELERSKLEARVEEAAIASKMTSVVFHYSSRFAVRSIQAEQCMYASRAFYNHPDRQIRPSGAYATHFQPWFLCTGNSIFFWGKLNAEAIVKWSLIRL